MVPYVLLDPDKANSEPSDLAVLTQGLEYVRNKWIIHTPSALDSEVQSGNRVAG